MPGKEIFQKEVDHANTKIKLVQFQVFLAEDFLLLLSQAMGFWLLLRWSRERKGNEGMKVLPPFIHDIFSQRTGIKYQTQSLQGSGVSGIIGYYFT